MSNKLFVPQLLAICLACCHSIAHAQDDSPPDVEKPQQDTAAETQPESESEVPEAPAEVSVSEVVEDHEIDTRLQEILASTDWFANEGVEVENGVVFLTGTTSDEKYRKWAAELAGKTEDVVAVVNRIKVISSNC